MPDDVVTLASANVELSPEKVEDISIEMHHLKVDDGESNESAIPSAYPDRPDAPDCLYYMRTGSCGYGNNCRYNHPRLSSQDAKFKDLPERAGQPDCGYYLKTGTCKYGFICKYHHPKDRISNGPVSFNARHEEKPCPHYMRYGHCKFGASCRFHHPPQPSQKPTFSFPYVTSLPSWAFSRTPYELHDPRSQNPTNCFPFVFLPISSGGTYTNTENDGILPQRPDQPECRYFMNNGTCKYGAECKFHHPKERIPNFLGPHGLPSRPGELMCASYGSNGFCKYGSTCRFDHPLLGYSYGYHFGVPLYPSDWGFVPREAPGVVRNVLTSDEGSPEPADSSDSGRLVNVSHATA